MKNRINEVLDLANDLRVKAPPSGTVDEPQVDPHFYEDPTASKAVEYAIKRRKNILIYGPTGCGKSSLPINICGRFKEAMEVFSCSGETSVDELIGKPWRVEKNGIAVTIPIYGAALRAYMLGKILLLEEVDFPNPDVHAALHRFMEPSQKFYHAFIGEAQTIERHPNFCVIATANTIGSGEDNYKYSGTKILNLAFLNRFSLTVAMDYLPADAETKVLIKKTGIQSVTANQMVALANEVRKLEKERSVNQIASVVSTRDLIEWADAVLGMGVTPVDAANLVFLNRMPESDREVVRRLVENRCS